MISSFLKSFNVSSGVERTAESENTNKAWCRAIEAIPNHRNWNTTDSMTMSSIERGARGFVFNVANQSVTLSHGQASGKDRLEPGATDPAAAALAASARVRVPA